MCDFRRPWDRMTELQILFSYLIEPCLDSLQNWPTCLPNPSWRELANQSLVIAKIFSEKAVGNLKQKKNLSEKANFRPAIGWKLKPAKIKIQILLTLLYKESNPKSKPKIAENDSHLMAHFSVTVWVWKRTVTHLNDKNDFPSFPRFQRFLSFRLSL